MRLKKQSMREVRDAGMVSRTDERDTRVNQPQDRPQYYRGALIKPKPETKTNGK